MIINILKREEIFVNDKPFLLISIRKENEKTHGRLPVIG